MRKTVILSLVLLLLPMSVAAQEKPAADANAALKFTTREYGVPLADKIPFLNRLFRTSRVTEDYVWNKPHVAATVISRDGRYMLVGSSYGRLDLLDLESPEQSRQNFADLGPLTFEFKEDNPVFTDLCWLDFSHDASIIAVMFKENLYLLDRSTAELLRTVALPKDVVNWGRAAFTEMPVALSPCGRFFACEARENGVSCIKMIDTETAETVFTKPLPAVTWHNLVCKPGTDGGPTFITQEPAEGQDCVLPMCFSPDGRQLFLMLQNHGMEILDARTGETTAVLTPELTSNLALEPGKKWIPSRAAFSPDGKYLVTAGAVHEEIFAASPDRNFLDNPTSCKVLLWDVATFRMLRQWDVADEENPVEFMSTAFSPDGGQVLAAYLSRRDLTKHKTLLSLQVAHFELAGDGPVKVAKMSERGAIPLVPEYRPLYNSQASGQFHFYPDVLITDFDFSFRPEKISDASDGWRFLW